MARTPIAQKLKRLWPWQQLVILWNSASILARWRWRTQWFLLLVTGLGMTIAIVLMGLLPLFSDVMNTAGLRSVLRTQSGGSQFLANITINGISPTMVANASSQVTRVVKRDVGQYLTGTPQSTVITGDWYLPYGSYGFTMDLYGVPIQTAPSHLHLLAGHLPSANSTVSSGIDIALTRSAAQDLKVQVGDTIQIAALLLTGKDNDNIGLPGGPVSYFFFVPVHVVGIFQVNTGDSYWDGHTLEAPTSIEGQTDPPFLALTDQTTLFTLLNTAAQKKNVQEIYFANETENSVFLSYTLNASSISSAGLDTLISHMGVLEQDISSTFLPDSASNLISVDLSGATLHNTGVANPSTLEKFRSQEEIAQTPMLLLTAQIICLILFFISTVITALVERDQLTIAILRSRGASRLQVFGSLLIQGVTLSLGAALVGPLLAIGLVNLFIPHFLTPGTQDAMNALTLDPAQVFRSLGTSTLLAIAATLVTLLISCYLAVRANILTLRREEARSTRLPLWQRLRLDLVIAVLAISGYLFALYLENTQQFLSAQGQTLVSTPLRLLAPLLLLLAAILCFLRFFPLLLRLLMRLAQRRRDLSPMIALVQMERSPHQPMRMALLLGLATAFTFFALIFSASQGQRAQDLATYQAVSDFGGYNFSLPQTTPADTTAILNQTTTSYSKIQGVTSATVGNIDELFLYLNSGTPRSIAQKIVLNAVDAQTFAQTATWTSQDASQSLSGLMGILLARRSQAIQSGVVPAIVATNTWQALNLTPGATFHLTNDLGNPDSTTYLAVAEVNHIPPVDDNTQGALLVDYQTLVAGRSLYGEKSQLNYVWLRTSNNPGVVNQVRTTLNNLAAPLTDLVDRRALNSDSTTDPLANNLIGTLSIGVAAALFLAFLANLLLPLLSVRLRQTNFAVLRALGTTPGQVASILTWELAIVLATALLLGVFFGALLTFTVVPPLVFTGVLPSNLVTISSSAIYTLQQIIPVTIIIPSSLLVALAILLVLCLLALALMARLAQYPLLAQALLVDEN